MAHESHSKLDTRPLPGYLIQRYRGWKAVDYAENQVWYRRLATEGQRPRCMIIGCCDSRVNATQLFGAEPGEFFIHRNIANLVPPYAPDTDHHGTSAAVEYAVNVLKVTNLVVMGHSRCGGVQGCHQMCSGHSPELEEPESFVGRWLDILRPGYERIKDIDGMEAQQAALEKQAIVVSLENLLTFPFVRDLVESETLGIHGMWVDIASGELQVLDGSSGNFGPI